MTLGHYTTLCTQTCHIVPPQPWMDIPSIQTRSIIWMVTSVYMCGMTFYNPWHHHSHPHHCLFPSSFTSGQYLLLSKLNHPWATSSAPAQSCSSYHSRDKVWNVVEDEKMEILSGDKVPLGDNRSATHRKLYVRHNLALFNVSSLHDLYAHI